MSSESSAANVGGKNVLKVLVATDSHVGFAERDPVRCNDAINAFEEVLKLAKQHNVDLLLLGGDLFHENKPSRECMHGVLRLLRRHCFGDGAVHVRLASDAALNFAHSAFATANYEDANLNVSLPVFTIHGNHDDLSGKGLTALDVLHEAGALNLFGKFRDCTQLQVLPVLLTKGDARLALFGIGAQRDDRLARAFQSRQVDFQRPREHADDWFNLLVLHQNRPARGTARASAAHVRESFLPDFIDLVVWGHEHECRIDPVFRQTDNEEADGLFIMQPGSSVATSLSQEEAGDKKVALLKIRGKEFKSEAITLQTVRQFYWEEVTLADEGLQLPRLAERRAGRQESDEILCQQRVEALIARAAAERRPQQPPLPLIRVRVVYSGEWESVEPFSIQRFGQQFVDRVANPKDLLIFKKARARAAPSAPVDRDALDKMRRQDAQELQTTVEDLVKDYFEKVQKNADRLVVLTEGPLAEALRRFVDKDDGDAVAAVVRSQVSVCARLVGKELRRDVDASALLDQTADGNESMLDDEEAAVMEALSRIQHINLQRQQQAASM